MSDFDELLQRVLSEDANIVPPEGMERRIRLALTMKAKPFAIGRRLWLEIAAAAMFICVVGTWAHQRLRLSVAVATPARQRAMAEYPSKQMPLANREILVTETSQSEERRWTFRTATKDRRRVRNAAVEVEALEIKPLTVQPIEIAALTSHNLTEKGEVR